MIPLALSSALAAPAVEVWAAGPVARTAAVTYALPEAGTAGAPSWSSVDPARRLELGGGVALVTGAPFGPQGHGVVDLAIAWGDAVWAREPTDVGATTWSARVGAGWRMDIGTPEAPVWGGGEGGLTLAWGAFLPTNAGARWALAPGVQGRVFAAFGHGPVSPQLGARVGAQVGPGRTEIIANGPAGYRLRWWPAAAYVLVEIGVHFQGRTPS